MSGKISKVLWLAIGLALLPALVGATELTGTWERSNGKAHFRFEPCGGETCAILVWKRPDVKKGTVGQTVFRKLVPSGENSWTGEAYDPDSGRVFKGTLVLKAGKLHTKGCALAGLICKSDTWTRID